MNTLKDLDRYFVGFDKVAERLAKVADQSVKMAQNYPPYNVRKLDENKYSLELAVAGFGIQDLEIEMLDGTLTIKGKLESEASEEGSVFPTYLWKGISAKPFTRQFTLADNVEIRGAEMLNGILKIWLESVATQKPSTKIKIKEAKA